MALRTITGSGGRAFAVGLQEEVGKPVVYRGASIVSTAATVPLAIAADVENAGDVTLTTSTWAGFGPIEITLSAGAAGTMMITGITSDGINQTETLTYTSSDTVMTTTNNFISTTDNPITIANSAFGSGITASVEVNTIAGRLYGMGQRYYPCSAINSREVVTNVESNLRNSTGADTANVQGQFSGAFDATTGLLIDSTPNFMVGILNHIPTNVDVAPVATDPITISATVSAVNVTLPTGSVVNHPSKLKIVVASPTPARLRVTGFIKAGVKTANANTRFREEFIDIVAATTEYETEHYFLVGNPDFPFNITVVTAPAADLMATGSWDPELVQTDMAIQANDEPFDRWTIEGLIDSVPHRVVDAIPNVVTVTATETSVDLAIQALATEVVHFATVDSGHTEVLEIDPNDRYPDASDERTPPWATVFSYGDITVPATNITLTFNRNYEADTAFDGDRNQTNIYAGNVRQITVNATTRWQVGDATDMFARWPTIYREDRRTPLSLRCYYYTALGQRSQIQFTFPSSQLTDPPEHAATADGPIDITLNFKSLVTAANRSEYNVTFFTPNGYVE